MKYLISFDPKEDLIYLSTTLHGPLGAINARMALDTGATVTMINQDILRAAGYDLDQIYDFISIVTGSRVESVKQLTIHSIRALDHVIENLPAICHDLPEESGLDGLLGLNFLRYFDVEIRYSESSLLLRPLSA
jgi:predicted aspartyl protease